MNREEFAKYLFNRTPSNKHWAFSPDKVESLENRSGMPDAIIDLLENCHLYASHYSEEQIAQGLDYLINPSLSNLPFLFFGKNIDSAICLKFFESTEMVYEGVFGRLCKERLSYNQKNVGALNTLCYMWWEILPYRAILPDGYQGMINVASIKTMGKIIGIDNIACKESALHGLSLLAFDHPKEVRKLIKDNLKRIPECLQDYAQQSMLSG